jgi:hypothetical protein
MAARRDTVNWDVEDNDLQAPQHYRSDGKTPTDQWLSRALRLNERNGFDIDDNSTSDDN